MLIENNETIWDEIICIEETSCEDVYDLTVDDVHNFFANDLLVHNCSELTMCPNDSCRLLVTNVASFVESCFKEDAIFDFEHFHNVVMKAQRLMDDLVDLEIEAVEKILQKIESDPQPEEIKRSERELWQKIKLKCVNGRRTGTGITGLGDTIAMLGIRYGSDESIQITEEIYKANAIACHTTSVILAKERGAFPIFDYSLEKDHEYLNKIMSVCTPEIQKMWRETGRRNIALTTTAPGGSISIEAQVTSGIEPVYSLMHKRRRRILPGDSRKPDFIDDSGDLWQEYIVYHHQFKKWMEISGKTAIEDSPYYKSTANDVDWISSVKLQAAAQKWVDHAISKTCGLPNEATRELVSDVYMTAWKSGCKGQTVYRDGSRAGILLAVDDNSSKKKSIEEAKSPERSAAKRPKELPCDIHNINIKGENWVVLVGLHDGKPYEIFCGLSGNIEIPKKIKSGTIIKIGKKNNFATYNLIVPVSSDDQIIFKDISNLFDNPTQNAFTRTISLTLRHGVPINFVVEQIQKGKENVGDMFTFGRCIARVLKTYIPDGVKSFGDKICPDCKMESLVYKEGCVSCESCGHSRCS